MRSVATPGRRLGVLIAAAMVAFSASVAPAATEEMAGATAPRSPAAGGGLVQLPGAKGCLMDRSHENRSCGSARALQGPGPFLGSRAVAVSPDGRNIYVASSESDAIAIFSRRGRGGALTQRKGTTGCIAAGTPRCASADGLDGPNSVAVSPDGKNVYATSRDSSSLTVFRRKRSTGALRQMAHGCIAQDPVPGCGAGRALRGADVVTVSPDGTNVYVGAFFGSAVAMFDRDASRGALSQPADASGCITELATRNCSTGIALQAPEGLAISGDGRNVYVASAASNAVVALRRDRSTGALTEATNGRGCVVDAALAGCTTGRQLSGANAVEVSPDNDNVYVTSLFSNSITSFNRPGPRLLAQKGGSRGCLVYQGAASGCAAGEALEAPEGVAVSPDGGNLFAASFETGAIAVLARGRRSGAVVQLPGKAGCVARHAIGGCRTARGLRGVSSMVPSPDGRYLYAVAFGSDAVSVFRRRG